MSTTEDLSQDEIIKMVAEAEFLFTETDTDPQKNFNEYYQKFQDVIGSGLFEPLVFENQKFNIYKKGCVNLSLLLEDESQTYGEWVSDQEYEYETPQAEAYDYVEKAVDIDKLADVCEVGVRFLDNIVSHSRFPDNGWSPSPFRDIGIGVSGWTETCEQMGIKYGSDESLQIARVAMSHVNDLSTKSSHELASERGVFTMWEESHYADPTENPEWFRQHVSEFPADYTDGYEIRNSYITRVVADKIVPDNSSKKDISVIDTVKTQRSFQESSDASMDFPVIPLYKGDTYKDLHNAYKMAKDNEAIGSNIPVNRFSFNRKV